MFTPFRHAIPGMESQSGVDSTGEVLVLHREGQSVIVDHDGFTLGSSVLCDLTLDDESIGALHGIIHLQQGAVWIESASDDASIIVNDRPCRRMALRNDDRIQIGCFELTAKFLSKIDAIASQPKVAIEEDLSLLTAEELCDRIIAEQVLLDEFNDGRRAGWDALMQAIEAAKNEVRDELSGPGLEAEADPDQAQIEELLKQIEQLNQTITERREELSHREREVLDSAKLLEEQQRDVSQRLDAVLDQLNNTDPPSELRASA